MLHLMIVDDDALMCNQLAALLDWRELGIEIVSYASSGEEAVRELEKQEIGLVLTDMDMPGMNGVELIEHISSHYPDIHVIALSGYDDFHFVRGSMKYGAHDYVLKSRLSKEVLENLISEILQKDRALDDMKNHMNLTHEQLSESFFNRLLRTTDFDLVQIDHIIKNLGIKFNKDCLAVILADCYLACEDEVLSRSLFHMCQQILKEADFFQPLVLGEGRFCFVVSFKNEASQAAVLKKLETWGRLMSSNGKKFFNAPLRVSISDICRDIGKLKHYYEQAEEQAAVFFYDETVNFICAWAYGRQRVRRKEPLKFPDVKKLKQQAAAGKREEAEAEWSGFFQAAKETGEPVDKMQQSCRELLNRLLLFAEEQDVNRAYLLGGRESIREVTEELKTLFQWEQLFNQLVSRFFEALSPEPEMAAYHKYTRYALRKIHTQYAEPLSLSDMAAELGISGAYLSNTFKNDVGTGFNDYLNKLRIEKVIEGIRRGDGKLKEIAGSCGLQNYNYFFRVFKEYTGMTPTQYFS